MAEEKVSFYHLIPPEEYANNPHPIADWCVNNGMPSALNDTPYVQPTMPINVEKVHNNMNGMMDFIFEGNKIHIIVEGTTPDYTLFSGPEVASILGYKIAPHMYDMLLPNEKVNINMNTIGNSDSNMSRGNPNVIFVTLPGLFRVISRSRHPKAMDFQNWVYHVVLPSIWNYGYYASVNTRNIINNEPEIAVLLNKKIEELESLNSDLTNQVNVMEPYANTGEFVVNNMGDTPIEVLAKLLNSSGIDIGRNRLFELLRKEGYLMKHGSNRPTQKSLDMGIMTFKNIILPNGCRYLMVYVTPKGIAYFINKYRNYSE